METPILFIIYNRPEPTREVFASIRAMKPKRLFIAADGPRSAQQGEVGCCLAARRVTENIDWPCEIFRKYEEKNLGCRVGVSSAINWFFDNVEQGIILEDDCLPSRSFFYFCEELLARYADEERAMMISGNNFIPDPIAAKFSYRFSNYAHIWGWATWRRAWQKYDQRMVSYPQFKKENLISNICSNKKEATYWVKLFDRVYDGKIDTWDAQWQYSIFKENGWCVVPKVNLVSNIGFGADATHTKIATAHSRLPILEMGQLAHPPNIARDVEADRREMVAIIPTSQQKMINILRTIYGHLQHLPK